MPLTPTCLDTENEARPWEIGYGVSVPSSEHENSQITRRAGVVAAGTLTSRLLGLGRDIAIAATFSRAATDAWFIAWQIPNLLRQVLAEGAVQTAVLPVLSEVREQQGENAAREFYRVLLGFFLFILILVSLLGVWMAPQLTKAFAAGFAARDGQLELTSSLTRAVFPYIFFMGVAALGLAALNTHRRFVVTSFAPALLNVSFLVCALTLPAWLGARGFDAVYALVVGGLAGGALQVVAQWPSLKRIGYLSLPSWPIFHPALARVLRRLAPTLVGVGVYALDVLIGRRMLAALEEGAVTYFSYALRLCDFSQGIFIMALSSATLPTLSTFVAQGRLDDVAKTFWHSLRLALFVGIVAAIASVALAPELVSTVLGRGRFRPEDVTQTTLAFYAQAFGIVLVAAVRQMVIVFFALGKTMIPVYVAMADVLVFTSVGLSLSDEWGHVGVSWAVTAARLSQFLLLGWALRRALPDLQVARTAKAGAKTLLAALLAAAVTWTILRAGSGLSDQGGWGAPLGLLLGGVLFVVVFWGCARALKVDELDLVLDPVVGRLRGMVRR